MRVVRVALAALFLAAAACGGADAVTSNTTTGGSPGGPGGTGGETCSGTTNAITVGDNQFSPSCTKVPVGTTVTWTWMGGNPHNVTFSNTALGASPTQTSGTYSKQFANAGTFGYACTVHPGMTATVQVQ